MSAHGSSIPRRCSWCVVHRVVPRRWALQLAVGLMLVAGVALGQSGGSFSITRHSVDAGGARSSGGGFVLVGTIGQPDAAALQGGGFSVQGGFHRRATGAPADALFANGFE